MVCIYCGGETQVANSRHQRRLNQVWRRRECQNCHAVFTTEESADYSASIVVRHPATPVNPKATQAPFSRDKLFTSVLRAVGHRQSPLEDASALTATITAKLLKAAPGASVSPTDIITITLETLKRFDTAAAVQYQAYHKG